MPSGVVTNHKLASVTWRPQVWTPISGCLFCCWCDIYYFVHLSFPHTRLLLKQYLDHTFANTILQPCVLKSHTVWRENLASIIFGESVKCGDLNFGDNVPAGLASRLRSCTYTMYRYRHLSASSQRSEVTAMIPLFFCSPPVSAHHIMWWELH